MKIHPAGTPVEDPFFAAVRRRHPDVDIVLLPPDERLANANANANATQPADAATVRDALAAAETTTGEVWAAAAPLTSTTPTVRLAYGGAEDRVRASACVVDQRRDGFAVLVSLRHELERRGWELERVAGSLERIEGRRNGATVAATYAEETGTIVLELRSADLEVGTAEARRLVRGTR